MDCENCKNKQPEMVSRYAMEELSARQDIANRRSFVINIILIILLLASWIGFFVYESQFEDVSVTQDVDTGEGSAYVAGVGDVYYGESETNSQG